MKQHVVVESGKISRMMLSGVVLGLASAMVAWGLWSAIAIADQEVEQMAVVKACNLPDVNGAMTVFVMEDNKLRCWRWK